MIGRKTPAGESPAGVFVLPFLLCRVSFPARGLYSLSASSRFIRRIVLRRKYAETASDMTSAIG